MRCCSAPAPPLVHRTSRTHPIVGDSALEIYATGAGSQWTPHHHRRTPLRDTTTSSAFENFPARICSQANGLRGEMAQSAHSPGGRTSRMRWGIEGPRPSVNSTRHPSQTDSRRTPRAYSSSCARSVLQGPRCEIVPVMSPRGRPQDRPDFRSSPPHCPSVYAV